MDEFFSDFFVEHYCSCIFVFCAIRIGNVSNKTYTYYHQLKILGCNAGSAILFLLLFDGVFHVLFRGILYCKKGVVLVFGSFQIAVCIQCKSIYTSSLFSSIIRLINSLIVMPSLLARRSSHLYWDGVNTTERWRTFMECSNTLIYPPCQGA